VRTFGLTFLKALCVTAVAAQQAAFVHVACPDVAKGPAILFEDSRGGLWLGGAVPGAEGLTYFDGSRFIKPAADFPKTVISGITEDSEGGIWIASRAGLHRLLGKQLEKVTGGLAGLSIVRIASDAFLLPIAPPGMDPFADENDMVRVSRSKGIWRAETIAKSLPNARYSLGSSGDVLYPCPLGVCEIQISDIAAWRPGKVLGIKKMPLALQPKGGAVFQDREGCFWSRREDAGFAGLRLHGRIYSP